MVFQTGYMGTAAASAALSCANVCIACGAIAQGGLPMLLQGCAAAIAAGITTALCADATLRFKGLAYREHSRNMSVAYGLAQDSEDASPEPGSPELTWARALVEAARGDGIEPWEAQDAERAGLTLPKGAKVLPETRWGLSRPMTASVAMSTVSVAACAAAAVGLPIAAACAFASAALACAHACACDLSTRTIPWQSCAALAVCGCAFQALACGTAAAVAGLAGGCATLAISAAARRSESVRRSFGGGDARMLAAAIIACGPSGLAAGALACATCAAVSTALRAARGCGKSMVPMAPYLAAWAAVGMAIAPMGTPWALAI